MGAALTGYTEWYQVKHGLSDQQKQEVALAIWEDLADKFEENQGQLPKVLFSNSSFSQEDLPSDVIAFYMALSHIPNREALLGQVDFGTRLGKADAALFLKSMGDLGDENNKNRTFWPVNHNKEIADFFGDGRFANLQMSVQGQRA